MKDKVLGELKNIFRPEFLNRIDATVAFHSLDKEQIRDIVDLMHNRVRGELVEQEMKIEVTVPAKDFLVEKGFDQAFGARPLRRAIQNHVEDPLAQAFLEGRFHRGDTVLIDCQNDELVMTKAEEEAEEEALVETA
jgi:ATP-dependent Clp protease ATP-binding subunit ClpC